MSAKVFVGNLDFKTTRDEVQSLFSQIGPIRDVFLPTDRDSGRPRGFAFVEFESEEDAQKAIERFNGYELSGRALRVNAAEDRPRGGPRPGGGYQGGGFDSGERFPPPGKSKGSRRNIRSKKRSL
jgi:cold-inducible RNA-binding protein